MVYYRSNDQEQVFFYMRHTPYRHILIFLFITIYYLQISAFANDSVPIRKPLARSSYRPGEILIKYKDNIRKSSRTREYQNGMSTIKKFKHTQCEHLRLPPGMTVAKALETFGNDPDVLWVEPNYIRRKMAIAPPDDPYYIISQWGLRQIDPLNAWEWGTDCSSVIIAVLDSGIDYTHPELLDNLWINPGEIENNGIDDDGNGLVDDVHGWNFNSMTETNPGDSNIFDADGHGSHVSGVIAATGNNAIGIAGVCWTAQIMVLKFLNENGVGSSAGEVAAIEYAIDHGARIINASFGGSRDDEENLPGYIQSERDAIEAAEQAGILFIVAAGNDGHNNDDTQEITGIPEEDYANYPASYSLDNIISVAASNRTDDLTYWSSYGSVSVDVAAPGKDIYAPYPGGFIPIFEESFEYQSDTNLWTFQDEAWCRTTGQSLFGSYSLSISPNDMTSSETSAITPGNNISGKTGIELIFFIQGNTTTASQKLFVETGPTQSGPWINQVLEVEAPDGHTNIYDQGFTGTDLPSQWTQVKSSLTLTGTSDTVYIRFRLTAEGSAGESDSDDGFCFVSAAWADVFSLGMWYIDAVILQGVDLSGTIPSYKNIDGTSFAVPFVSGLAGLIWNSFPDLTYDQVKAAILDGVDPLNTLEDRNKILSGGRINAYESLNRASGY